MTDIDKLAEETSEANSDMLSEWNRARFGETDSRGRWKERALLAESDRDRLSARVAELEAETGKWEAFGREICQIAFEGGDADGSFIEDVGIKHGVLVKDLFDPEKHTNVFGAEWIEPGDEFLRFPNSGGAE